MLDNSLTWYSITAIQAFLASALIARIATDLGSLIFTVWLLKITLISIAMVGFIALSFWAMNEISNRFVVAEVEKVVDREKIQTLKIFDLPRLILISATPLGALIGFLLVILL